ncbi:MAG: magnesium transporter [Chloroflexales bacterium]|nr:magnesium transporter [Chloroflexales bacterium]
MIAFRTTTDRDALRAPVIRPRFHGAAPAGVDLAYAPALSFPRHATAQQVINALRMMRPGNESVYYLFVTGEEDRLVGVVSLRQVVVAHPDTRLEAIMSREVVSLLVTMAPGQQAHVLGESGFLALPVVDEAGHLVGSLDATELLSAVEDKATEDMFHMAGVARDEELERPLNRAARDRVGWLMFTMAAAFLAAAVVSRFTGLIAHVAILAAFLPVVVGQGASAGFQTLTFIVRSLALGEVSLRNARSALGRELLLGLCNGLVIGILGGLAGFAWQGSAALGLVVGLAMLGTLIVAALAGVAVPLALRALHIDPARTSSIFVTTATSLCGLGLLLGLGALASQMGYL